jgi:formyl-CoA transferase
MSILEGIRVIDCGTYIAGPAAATILSDFGADVIKVESPRGGDPYRRLGAVPGMPVSSHNYCWILDGRNRRSLTLDLSNEEGRGVLQRLIGRSDVFITNFQPDLVSRFGLTYEELSALNSRLVYAYVTGYGEQGGEAGKPGYDTTAYWARSGLMGMMYNADSEPTLAPAGFGDHPTATSLFGAIMLALYQREKTGKGARVTTSLMASGAWSNGCQIQAAHCGAEFPAQRTRSTTINPLVNHYVTRDGFRFILCCLEPRQDWPRLCHALGFREMIGNPRFHTFKARTEHARELVELLDRIIGGMDMAECARLFKEHGVVWGPVPTAAEVAQDEQMRSNGVFPEMESAQAAALRTVDSPMHVDGVRKRKPAMPPEIGEHSREILRELGYSEEEAAALAAAGAIGG